MISGELVGCRLGEKAAPDLGKLGSFGFKSLDQQFCGFGRTEGRPAGEDVGRGVIELGPGMNRDMRFSDGEYAGYPLGSKAMEGLADYVGAQLLGGLEQSLADVFQVIKKRGVTLLELQQKMKT